VGAIWLLPALAHYLIKPGTGGMEQKPVAGIAPAA
jgi:hypothetical protein